METENTQSTNEPLNNASSVQSGDDVGGSLSEADFIRDFVAKREPQASETTDAPDSELNDIVDIENNDESDESEHDSDSGDELHTNADEDETDDESEIQHVKIDGKVVEVKLSELKSFYSKGKAAEDTFRQASDLRKEADEIKSSYGADRDALKNELAKYQNFMNEQMKAHEPDWESLKQYDYVEYLKQKDMWDTAQAEVARAARLQEAIKTQETAERAKLVAQHVATQEAELLKTYPKWKNPEVRDRDMKEVVAYMKDLGFTKQEMDSVGQARIIQVLMDAVKYRQAVKAQTSKVVKPQAGKTLSAGAQNTDPGFAKRQAQTQNARAQKALNENFKANGDLESFTAAFKSQMRRK